MRDILLNNGVIVYLLSETILYLLLFLGATVAIHILRKWDFTLFTSSQFALENRAYLVMTIVWFSLALKSILLPFFIYTIDSLALLIPGAMCGAGVIKANGYGNPLLILKLVLLLLSGLWLTINHNDLKATDYPYMRLKSWLYLLIFLLLSVELAMDILYFTHIQTDRPVSCCSVIFGALSGANGLPFGLDISTFLILFYLLFIGLVWTILSSQAILSVMTSLVFGVSAYYSVVYFFGTYIYELPTHRCPFCMMQDHYYYVGYLIWGLLFAGIFLVIQDALMEKLLGDKSIKLKKLSIGFLGSFVGICSAYVVHYYFKNGVFL